MLNRFRKLVFSLPVQLIAAIALAAWGASFLDLDWIRSFYAVSLTIKGLLIFFLPIVVFSCVFSAISSMPKGAFTFVALIVGSLCVSNFTSTMVAYNASQWLISPSAALIQQGSTPHAELQPLWNFPLQPWISNGWALFLGCAFGILVSYRNIKPISRFAELCIKFSHFFLNRFFIPILPVFIFGFSLKLAYDNVIVEVVKNNLISVLTIVLVIMSYITLLYLISSRFSLPRVGMYLKNMFSPVITAFSSMSSAATLPLSIRAAELNSGTPEIARAVIPSTVNIHLVGDSISIPMMAIIILNSFGVPLPDFSTYLLFSLHFVMSKFAVAAVPGGGILVMVPVLEKYLGFSSEMSALITAFYILLDPVITSANVLGNNAFCVLFSQAFKNRSLLGFQTHPSGAGVTVI